MERQFSVGLDRSVKEDHLWRWTTFTGKFPPGPNCSIYVWTEISGNFGTMESTRCFTSWCISRGVFNGEIYTSFKTICFIAS